MAKKKQNNEEQPLPKLTSFEEQFIGVYFNLGFNATAAYKMLRPNITEESARVMASTLLTKLNVQASIQKYKERIENELIKENLEIQRLKKEIEINELKLKLEYLNNDLLIVELKNKINQSLDNVDSETKKLLKELNKKLSDDLYFILSPSNNLIKIGRSNRPHTRLIALKSEVGFTDLELIKILPNGGKLEKKLHLKFKEFNHQFITKDRNNTEWFIYNDEIKKFIEEWEEN